MKLFFTWSNLSHLFNRKTQIDASHIVLFESYIYIYICTISRTNQTIQYKYRISKSRRRIKYLTTLWSIKYNSRFSPICLERNWNYIIKLQIVSMPQIKNYKSFLWKKMIENLFMKRNKKSKYLLKRWIKMSILPYFF